MCSHVEIVRFVLLFVRAFFGTLTCIYRIYYEKKGKPKEQLLQIMEANAMMLNTIEILDDEKESILSEALKCYVCLELPAGKQVRICEEGHHFCLTCHNKMEVCGICRGKLLDTRNFVVEQLVTKLGGVLGISRCEQGATEPPFALTPGRYKCLHCNSKMPAYQMLAHLRAKHSNHLVENIRSNPYSERFSFKYNVVFVENGDYIWSVRVSDMGLFTVQLNFCSYDFLGFVRGLGDQSISSLFRYQLVVKIPNSSSDSFLEFSLTECPVSNYLDDVETVKRGGRVLKIKGENLLEHITNGSTVSVFFSVWKAPVKAGSKKSPPPSVFCPPERHLFFENDRKIRRNRNRNLRRKKLRDRLKNDSADVTLTLGEELERIVL